MRRQFLKNIAGLSLMGVSLPKFAHLPGRDLLDKLYKPEYVDNQLLGGTTRYPKLLNPGDTIAITAPASPTNNYEVRHGVNFYKRLGFKVVIGDTIKYQQNKYRYLSAPDKVRAMEFMEFIESDKIDAIHTGRGGYGSMRILNYLNYDMIRYKSKAIIGYSDITAILNAVYNMSNLVTFHGPVALSTFDAFSSSSLRNLIIKDEFKPKVSHSLNTAKVLVPGNAKGKIVGGNLTILSSTIGTLAEINTKDSIVFLEDVSENAYQIDRMLNHLILAGKFDDCAGIIVGKFKNLNIRRPFFPNMGFTIKEVIDELLVPLNKPLVIEAQFGHIDEQFTLPIGCIGEIDTKNKTFSIETEILS